MTRHREGYILVAVLGTVLVLAGLIGSATLVAQSALRAARADASAAALDGMLRGGLELAAYQVFALKAPFAAVNGRPLRLPGGTAVPVFSDEAEKVDINASDPAVLQGAFRAAGLDDGIAAALRERLVAMRGSTTRSDTPVSAPDAIAGKPPGSAATGGTQGAHTDFASVADFLAFAGLDRAATADLEELLTVNNPDGLVDVMTAGRRVLLTLPGLSEAKADAILGARRDGPAAVADLKAMLADQGRFVKFEPGPCFGIDVVATDALGRSARRHGVVAASRSAAEPFYLLGWGAGP